MFQSTWRGLRTSTGTLPKSGSTASSNPASNSIPAGSKDENHCKKPNISVDNPSLMQLKGMWECEPLGSRPDIQSTILAEFRAFCRKKNKSTEGLETAATRATSILREASVAPERASEMIALFKQSVMCADMRKSVFKLLADPKPKTRSRLNRSEKEFCDETIIPAGMDLLTFGHRTDRQDMVSVHASLDSALVPKLPGHFAYAYNVPNGASEQDVKEALWSVGAPVEVSIYSFECPRSRTPGKRSRRVSSRTNALLRFESLESLLSSTNDEAKLFGVLCKSSDSSLDGPRTMFLEPAERKRVLVFSMLSSDRSVDAFLDFLKDGIEEGGLGSASLEKEKDGSFDRSKTLVGITFPSFETAVAVFKFFRAKYPERNVMFSALRTKWEDGAYTDMATFTRSD